MKRLQSFLLPLLLSLLLPGLISSSQAASHQPRKSRAVPAAPAAVADYSQRPAVLEFIREMQQQHGLEAEALRAQFQDLRPLAAVIRAVQPPRDPQVRSWQRYRARFIEPVRIDGGLQFWQRYQNELASAQRSSGVPAEYIVAIIGIESIYGQHMGRFQTLNALATLAFDYPAINPQTDAQRAALFRGELAALLLLARDEGRDAGSYRGSYAGALGLPQFLPSSIRRYARDGDQDGHIDLSNNPADAIASVASFLQQHGWQTGGPVAVPVSVSGERYPQLIEEGILPRRTPAELADFGVQPDNPATALAEAPAALIDLVSPGAETLYRLGYRNFYVITRYNRSSFYAMAVHELATTLRAAHEQSLLCCAGGSRRGIDGVPLI